MHKKRWKKVLMIAAALLAVIVISMCYIGYNRLHTFTLSGHGKVKEEQIQPVWGAENALRHIGGGHLIIVTFSIGDQSKLSGSSRLCSLFSLRQMETNVSSGTPCTCVFTPRTLTETVPFSAS